MTELLKENTQGNKSGEKPENTSELGSSLPTTLLQRLKTETAPMHRDMEKIECLKKIFDGTNTLENYKLIISKFYSFIKTVESELENNTTLSEELKAFLPDYPQRLRSSLLARDLEILGINKKEIKQCSTRPKLETLENFFGYFYVIEGSSLGGIHIHKALASTFQDLVKEYNYFNSYGNETHAKWKGFCGAITDFSSQRGQTEEIVNSAKETFVKLYQHFQQP
ncbi:MAG: biliverdin-producing heme oxygenase [Candidatus Caenarcaniphilales bacterium]|nr:biliverdin-producing heme oxygenase [Candidatus Caenarcaniphilales bacterium]